MDKIFLVKGNEHTEDCLDVLDVDEIYDYVEISPQLEEKIIWSDELNDYYKEIMGGQDTAQKIAKWVFERLKKLSL